MLAALADKAAAILTDQRAAFLRRQDANVEAAIEQARPVRREKRLAAILGNFTLARDPRVGPKYQIEVVPLALWRPAALCDGDNDEHAEPMHVPTQVVEAELAEQRRSDKGSELTQDEAEFVDSRFYRAKTDAAPAPSAAPLPPDPLAAVADMPTDPLAEAALQWEAQAAKLVATARATALAGRARALDEWTRHARARLRVRLLTAFVSAAVHGYADVAAVERCYSQAQHFASEVERLCWDEADEADEAEAAAQASGAAGAGTAEADPMATDASLAEEAGKEGAETTAAAAAAAAAAASAAAFGRYARRLFRQIMAVEGSNQQKLLAAQTVAAEGGPSAVAAAATVAAPTAGDNDGAHHGASPAAEGTIALAAAAAAAASVRMPSLPAPAAPCVKIGRAHV